MDIIKTKYGWFVKIPYIYQDIDKQIITNKVLKDFNFTFVLCDAYMASKTFKTKKSAEFFNELYSRTI